MCPWTDDTPVSKNRQFLSIERFETKPEDDKKSRGRARTQKFMMLYEYSNYIWKAKRYLGTARQNTNS